jgi:hypothetical protein
MILIFGSRTNRRVMGRLMHGFTFFFIPCVPMGSHTHAVCEVCGFSQALQNAWADQALRAAAQMPCQPQCPG